LFCLYIVVLSISRPARIYHPQDNKFRDGKGNVNTRANDIGFFKAEVKESDKQRYRPRPSTFGGSLKQLEYFDAQMASDRRVAYASKDIPHLLAVHRAYFV
jgi:hypothetical protein